MCTLDLNDCFSFPFFSFYDSNRQRNQGSNFSFFSAIVAIWLHISPVQIPIHQVPIDCFRIRCPLQYELLSVFLLWPGLFLKLHPLPAGLCQDTLHQEKPCPHLAGGFAGWLPIHPEQERIPKFICFKCSQMKGLSFLSKMCRFLSFYFSCSWLRKH